MLNNLYILPLRNLSRLFLNYDNLRFVYSPNFLVTLTLPSSPIRGMKKTVGHVHKVLSNKSAAEVAAATSTAAANCAKPPANQTTNMTSSKLSPEKNDTLPSHSSTVFIDKPSITETATRYRPDVFAKIKQKDNDDKQKNWSYPENTVKEKDNNQDIKQVSDSSAEIVNAAKIPAAPPTPPFKYSPSSINNHDSCAISPEKLMAQKEKLRSSNYSLKQNSKVSSRTTSEKTVGYQYRPCETSDKIITECSIKESADIASDLTFMESVSSGIVYNMSATLGILPLACNTFVGSVSSTSNLISETESFIIPKILPKEIQQEIKDAAVMREERRKIIEEAFKSSEETIKNNKEIVKLNAQKYCDLSLETQTILENLSQQASILLRTPWTLKHTELLQEINKVITEQNLKPTQDITVITRDIQEAIILSNMYELRMSEEISLATKEFLIKPTQKVCYTLEHYKKEIRRLHEGQKLLQFYHDQMPEGLFLEIVRRADVLQNLDAITSEDNAGPWPNSFKNEGYKIIKKESEGFTATPFIYDLNTRIISILTPEQKIEIIENITKKIFGAKIIVFPNINKLVENTQERHINLVVTYTKNDKSLEHIIFGNPTSSTDKDTVFVAQKQYVNEDPSEQHKAQRLRITKDPTRITPEELNYCYEGKNENENLSQNNIEKRFENFFKSNDYQGVNVHEILLKEVTKQYSKDQLCKLKQPFYLDHDRLNLLAQEVFKKKAGQLEEILKKNQTNDRNKQEQKDLLKNKQYNNYLAEEKKKFQKDMLFTKHKKILDIQEQLSEKEQQENKKMLHQKKKKDEFEKKV